MCLVLTLCFTSMTRTFCSPVAGCEVSSLFLYDFNVTLRNNNHMYVWIYFSCFNPFCFNGDTLLFPLFHLFNSLLNKTDRHDITEILLKVALKTITPFLKTLVKSPSFAHCIVCPSSIYRWWLPLWFLVSILLSVLLHGWLPLWFLQTFLNIYIYQFCWSNNTNKMYLRIIFISL